MIIMKTNSKLLIAFALLSFSLACNKSKTSTNSCAQTACTMEFRMIQVQVEDALGNAVVLDSLRVLDPSNKVLHVQTSYQIPHEKSYTLIDDTHFSKIEKFKNTIITAQFFKGASILKEQKYTVSADCCHIQLVDGPSKVILP